MVVQTRRALNHEKCAANGAFLSTATSRSAYYLVPPRFAGMIGSSRYDAVLPPA